MSKSVTKCLLIGINYKNTPFELFGCMNDTVNLKKFLTTYNYVPKEQIIMMNDHCNNELQPTKANIWIQLNNLVRFANLNRRKKVNLFIAYSGHGSQVVDKSGDEDDGLDEVIIPVDFKENGFITDDDLRERFINRLHCNVNLFWLMDCCYNDNALDLKYNYMNGGSNRCRINENVCGTKCKVVMISGECNNQTYVNNGPSYMGAMITAFILHFKPHINYETLLTYMRLWLQTNGFYHVPQLSSGHPISVYDQTILELFKL